MKLTSEQLKQFDEEGYLFFPDYFSPEETQILKNSVPEVFAQRHGQASAAVDNLAAAIAQARLDVLIVIGDDQKELFQDDNLDRKSVV